MKICPFVSHMLGDDNSNPFTLKGGNDKSSKKEDNVVILGYQDESSVDTMTEVTTEQGADESIPSHLHCLRESCRFYKAETEDCQFDLMFSMLDSQKDREPAQFDWDPDQITKPLSKDIDRIWKFQTKSVEELIKSFGTAEEGQKTSLSKLKKDIEKDLSSLSAKLEKSKSSDLKKELNALTKKLEDREQGFEDLSGTMSELVLNLHESITKLEDKSTNTLERVEKIADAVPSESALKEEIGAILDKRMKELEPADMAAPIEALRYKIDSLAEQNLSATYEEKIDATLNAQSKLESKSAAWYEEISERLQDIRTQQKVWEEKFSDMADCHAQIMERLDSAQQAKEQEKGRSAQKDAKKFNNLGVTSFHNGAYKMACDQFNQAVQLDPDFAEAYNNLGLAHTEIGNDSQASEAFVRAIELNPDLHAAYNNLGYIYFKKGEYEQAIEMYNEALGRSSDNSSAFTNLGNAYFKLDRTEDAKQAWSKALEIDPGNEKAKRNLARIGEDA